MSYRWFDGFLSCVLPGNYRVRSNYRNFTRLLPLARKSHTPTTSQLADLRFFFRKKRDSFFRRSTTPLELGLWGCGTCVQYLQSGPAYSKVHESGKNTALVYLPSILPVRLLKYASTTQNTTTTHNNQHEPLPPYPPAASALSLHG